MIENRIASYAGELRAIRRDLHKHPELLFDLPRTSAIVAKELARLGYKVTTGIAETGVVGTLSNGAGRKSMGIRADMDALPIHEATNLPYASQTPGQMHACGHDGHTAMLLGAARYLAETRNFDGTVHLIFQPAEEDIGGAKRMIEEGLFKRFPCDMVFALHNWPGEAAGQIMVRPGAITAAADIIRASIIGVGGHGAIPHKAVDPVVAASACVLALQTLVSRNLDPIDPAVITVGAFNAGSLATIIPEEASLNIGIRTCAKDVRDLMLRRVRELLDSQARSFGCRVEYRDAPGGVSYPPGLNDAAGADLVRGVALDMGQAPERVDLRGPFMFSEDFSYMQEAVPACYFGVGNGPSKNLHDPGYDFNDELLAKGPIIWARIVEKFLAKA
jgi:hippurate hydrolase